MSSDTLCLSLIRDLRLLPHKTAALAGKAAELFLLHFSGCVYIDGDIYAAALGDPAVKPLPDEYKHFEDLAYTNANLFPDHVPAWDGNKGVKRLREFALDDPILKAAIDLLAECNDIEARVRPYLAAVADYHPGRRLQAGSANRRVIEHVYSMLDFHVVTIIYRHLRAPFCSLTRFDGTPLPATRVRCGFLGLYSVGEFDENAIDVNPSDIRVLFPPFWNGSLMELPSPEYHDVFAELVAGWDFNADVSQSKYGSLDHEVAKAEAWLALGICGRIPPLEVPPPLDRTSEVRARGGRKKLLDSDSPPAILKRRVYQRIAGELATASQNNWPHKALLKVLRHDKAFVTLVSSLAEAIRKPVPIDMALLRAAKEWIRTNPQAAGPEKSA